MRANAPTLSQGQLRYVRAAARSLPEQLRDRFLASVSDHLAGQPSDDAVARATDLALRRATAFLNNGALG
jgi:hypothetical protein